MRRTVFGKHIAGEMIAPGQQGHFQFDLEPPAFRSDHHMIGRLVFKAVAGLHLEIWLGWPNQ